MRTSTYDKFPTVPVPSAFADDCSIGWEAIGSVLRRASIGGGRLPIIAVECYPGVHDDEVRIRLAAALGPVATFDAKQVFKSPAEIDGLVAPDLGGNDPVFGRMTSLRLESFLDEAKLASMRGLIGAIIRTNPRSPILIVGPAACLVAPEPTVFVFADMPRWEGQLRQRRGEVSNLGTLNRGIKASLQYKRSFFIDWRVADRLKRATMSRWSFVLDTKEPDTPKLISGAAHLAGLAEAASRPFRVVPFFDPGPWGGQWMRKVCALPPGPPNYAWCFDCVPEENSLILEFSGGVGVEVPAANLVFHQPVPLLGEPVYGRFGAEFPIRFDFLDTMGGGNLSFQVHPTADYAREHFGLPYTQDESYYILDATPDARVYLGRRNGTDFDTMMHALEAAEAGKVPFPADDFAAHFPAKKHDHFLIPAGTLHCSGAGSMVLEISATPYIFTFKLWDWNRVGLDGQPRPLNVARGREVIDWSRDEDYSRSRLVNQVKQLNQGEGWIEERTGLHEAEFIETRRHWFTARVPHNTGGTRGGGVNVLNLVEGTAVVVESPTGSFSPYTIHYAETFIIPAAVGAYTIRPAVPGERCATLKAFVRTRA